MTKKPNILFFMTDQQQADSIKNESYITPHLNRLARDGILFNNCYCSHPQCSPSRASLMTGLYPHQNGVYTLAGWGPYELDSDYQTPAKVLKNAGYNTTWFGKWDLGKDNVNNLGWETAVTYEGNQLREFQDSVRWYDCRTVEKAVDYLDLYDKEAPFILTVSLLSPHPPFYEDQKFANLYCKEEIPIPVSYDDDLKDKPDFHQKRAEKFTLNPEDVKEDNYRYRTMISRIDHDIGLLIQKLKEKGIYDNTVIIFTSDHGDMQGAHRLRRKGVIAYEELLKVPLIIKLPDNKYSGKEIDSLVSNITVPGTMIKSAGLELPEEFADRNLFPVIKGTKAVEGEVFFEHWHAYWGDHPFRGIRRGEWKYVEYYLEGEEELYNLDQDPEEMNNLANDQKFNDIKTELRQKVVDWWENTGGNESGMMEFKNNK